MLNSLKITGVDSVFLVAYRLIQWIRQYSFVFSPTDEYGGHGQTHCTEILGKLDNIVKDKKWKQSTVMQWWSQACCHGLSHRHQWKSSRPILWLPLSCYALQYRRAAETINFGCTSGRRGFVDTYIVDLKYILCGTYVNSQWQTESKGNISWLWITHFNSLCPCICFCGLVQLNGCLGFLLLGFLPIMLIINIISYYKKSFSEHSCTYLPVHLKKSNNLFLIPTTGQEGLVLDGDDE